MLKPTGTPCIHMRGKLKGCVLSPTGVSHGALWDLLAVSRFAHLCKNHHVVKEKFFKNLPVCWFFTSSVKEKGNNSIRIRAVIFCPLEGIALSIRNG